jgi:hypothetical protein
MQGTLADRLAGDARLAAIRSFEEVPSAGAKFGVALELVGYVRSGTANDDALVELERAVAILATKLGVTVNKGFLHVLDLPERLIPCARGADATAFDFTFVEFFRHGDGFGELREHGFFRGAGL